MSVVDHPNHYNLPGKKECIVQMREDFGDYVVSIFCLTNAYKYLYRAGHKAENSEKQDIEKAKWYYEYWYNTLEPIIDDRLSWLAYAVTKGLAKYYD